MIDMIIFGNDIKILLILLILSKIKNRFGRFAEC